MAYSHSRVKFFSLRTIFFSISLIRYDIFSLDSLSAEKREDLEGVEASRQYLEGLVSGEVNNGVPRKNIFVGGFSQGGAVALYTALKAAKEEPFAGREHTTKSRSYVP